MNIPQLQWPTSVPVYSIGFDGIGVNAFFR
jgi:hypothetical protein